MGCYFGFSKKADVSVSRRFIYIDVMHYYFLLILASCRTSYPAVFKCCHAFSSSFMVWILWKSIEKGIVDGIKNGVQPIIVLALIGILIGSLDVQRRNTDCDSLCPILY